MTIYRKTSKRALLALLIILMTTLAAEARVEFRTPSYGSVEIEKISDSDNSSEVADEKDIKAQIAKSVKAKAKKAEVDKAEKVAKAEKAKKAEKDKKAAKAEKAEKDKKAEVAKAEKTAKAELAKAEKAEKLAKAELAKAEKAEKLAKAELAKAEKIEQLAKAELAKTEKIEQLAKAELAKTGKAGSVAKTEKLGKTKTASLSRPETSSKFMTEESTEANAVGHKKVAREKIDRGIKMKTFMPKGTIFFGGTMSYTDLGATDYKFILFDNIKAKTTLIGVKVFAGYTFANNVAGGISFDYSRTLIRMDNVDISLSEDLNFAIKDSYSIQHIYTASAFLRAYINIGNSKRIGMFNDVRAYFSGGQGKVTGGIEQSPAFTGTYQKITKVGLVLQPGISVFATDFMTIEASIGILGVEYSRSEQITNQVHQGSFESFKASFKLNLLSVGLGLAFYF